MATVIIEQFNPASGCWNKLKEMDAALYDPAILSTLDKYGGPMRTRIVGEIVDDTIEKEVFEEEEEVFEDDIPQYDDDANSRWK